MSNVFFQLQVDVFIVKKIDVLKSLYNYSLKLQQEDLITKTLVFYHHVALMKMSNDFKLRLKQVYKNDKH